MSVKGENSEQWSKFGRKFKISTHFFMWHQWHHVVVVITTAQLHSTQPELRFCTGSNPACGILDICDGEYLW